MVEQELDQKSLKMLEQGSKMIKVIVKKDQQ